MSLREWAKEVDEEEEPSKEDREKEIYAWCGWKKGQHYVDVDDLPIFHRESMTVITTKTIFKDQSESTL